MNIIQNPKLQRLSIIIAVIFVAANVVISIILMIYNNRSSDLVETQPAIAETTCKVTINGNAALRMEDGFNTISLQDSVEVNCLDTQKIDVIRIGVDPNFGEDQWITPETEEVSIKLYAEDMGQLGEDPSIGIHGTSGELDIYLFEIVE